ncbi:proteasome adapter and scaffold protein ECM29-like isoform X1 [Haliotis rufescens]|uniref:proteasome adapter and scaffold protein ECM29-like isoform X1 n=1 Tax=Haliotis rufescens TaxID=6454 RepID=UPI00201F0D27|nr:proteasome adapter and scaffold protein ECM29-like isoform X1 [Haliotis rufescens]
MAGQPASQDEHALIERVFLRIGSAESDEQLETALGKFLAPVLIKLNSTEEGIRKKVMELLVHINKRLKSRPKVQLPVEPLLTQYQDPKATPFLTNFTILYIKMGYPRLSPEKQAEFVPQLVNCLEGRPQQHQDSLLQLLIPALLHLKLQQNMAQRRATFSFCERPAVLKLLLDFMMDVLLLPYNSHLAAIEKSAAQAHGGSGRPATAPAGRSGGTSVAPPPGLCEHAFKRVTGEDPLAPEALEQAKLGVLKFLGADVVPDADIVVHYVVASSDTRHSVATSADMELKRITGSINWNSPAVINKLFSIFQGTVVMKGQAPVKPDQRRTPACTRIRLKIFPIFLKSREAANTFPSCIQVVFDCLFGTNPNQKLRNMAVQLVHHISYTCDSAKFHMFDAVLLSGMVKLIGEAKEMKRCRRKFVYQDSKLRGLAYIAVGKIARRSPQRVAKDITLVQKFFEAVCQEDNETRLAVQEGLSMMSEAFKHLDDNNKKLMEALIMQNMDKNESQARLMAVQYAIAVFPQDHIPSRYILLLASGDIKEDIRGEAVKALHGGSSRSELDAEKRRNLTLPDFTQMIQYIRAQADQRKDRTVVGSTSLPFNTAAYTQVVVYLRTCLAYSAGISPELDTDSQQDQAPAIAKYVRQLLAASGDGTSGVEMYVDMLRQLLRAVTDPQVMYCLLEIVAVAPEKLAPQFKRHMDWLKNLISSSKDDIRAPAAQLFSIVILHSTDKAQVAEAAQEFADSLKSKKVELKQGSLLALGYLIGQLGRRGRSCDMQTDQASHNQELIQKTVQLIAGYLRDRDSNLLTPACIALGEIGRNAPLPVPPGGEEDKKEDITKWNIMTWLVNMLKTSKESNKSKERAAMCLGYICAGDVEFPHRRKAITELFNAVQVKQVDLHFTIGDALVSVAQGGRSSLVRDFWTQTEEEFQASLGAMQDEVEWFLTEILKSYVTHSNHHLRQASCIWLLSVLKKCGKHSSIQTHIQNIQRAFMQLLSESDEMTQDIASKGLGVVYENCTAQQKDMLVSELVNTLMTGKRPKQEVSGETQMFEEGSLGKTPEGGSMSTYKELCAIANDLNQPDLIYKFMHLANHNAMWNSRKGAAFGFTTIAAQAGEQLAPYLSQIVPRLYRYQFDPNPKIQQAMTSIWNALIQDNKKTVDTYLQEILRDLLKNLTSNQWRIRESSCLAVTDLLRGRPVDDIIEQLPPLWEDCLRVRDDIKESVRNAADMACKALSRVCVKTCDPSQGKVGERATTLMLPCILNCSLQSTVPEVRAIGLSTLLQISKNAGALMKPHIPVLVAALLEAVSGLEPQVMNYLSFHVSTQATQEKLDSARIAASKMSPMMETINRCVQYVDESVLPELVPRLVDLIKSGIGVGTKAGCSSFVVSLVHQCPQDLTPHAGKLMSAFLHGLSDRNSSVRKSYASALGYLVKIAKDSSVEKLINRLRSWYLEKEDESFRLACGLTLQAMSQHSSDALKRHATLAMPLAFFAMHEKVKTDEGGTAASSSQSVWEEVWQEITPGTEGGLRLYISEVVELLQMSLESQLWSTKAQAAAAMSTVATKLGSSLGPPHLGNLLTALLNGLQGRTWDGKEALLQALSTVCTSCKDTIKEKDIGGQPKVKEIVEAVLRESRKERPAYKIEALKCLGAIIEAYDLDLFRDVWDILLPMIKEKDSADKDEDKDDVPSAVKHNLKECAYTALGETWPTTPSTHGEFQGRVCESLCEGVPVNAWKGQVTILKTMHKFVDRLSCLKKENVAKESSQMIPIIDKLLATVIPLLGNMKYAVIRTESLAVIESIVSKLHDAGQLPLLSRTSVGNKLVEELSPMCEDGVYELREKAADLKKLLTASA